jgi:SAM-dependent methyltransferase
MSGCPMCLSPNHRVFAGRPLDFEAYADFEPKYVVLRCTDCDGLYLNPWPTPAEINRFYPPSYLSNTNSHSFTSKLKGIFVAHSAKKFAKQYPSTSRILDFGCGDGVFLESLLKHGFKNLYGCDPMPKQFPRISIAKDLSDFGGVQFDVIRMSEVIEHMEDLDSVMISLRKLLSPTGVLIGSTPNAAHPSSKIFKRFWGFLHFPYHTMIFSPKGLFDSAHRAGFSSVEIHKNLVPTCWGMTVEHFIKYFRKKYPEGHIRTYGYLLLLTAPITFLDFILSRLTSNMSFKLKV